jgi:hypothetical protein
MELHLKFYRVPWNRRGRRPCKFPGYPDQLWAIPPGQPKILLFFPGPGRVVLSWLLGKSVMKRSAFDSILTGGNFSAKANVYKSNPQRC